MKALKITIIALLAGFSMASCDFLDKEPTKLTPENYFNTPAEANSFLTGVYAILSQPTFYGGDYMYLVAGDDLSHYGGSGRGPASTGLICNNATTSDNAVTAFWYALYSGINRANMFLENIDKVNGFDAGVKEQYIAEARFLRAFYYFNLVECWGDVPFKTVSTQSVTNLNIPRTDKQEIYDFIISEMADAAETGLKSASDLAYKPGRISQSTAWGILARVYLFRAGEHYREGRNATQAEKKDYFERASFYAQKVMTAGHKLAANYWDPFIDMCSDKYNTTANESIWEAEFIGNRTADGIGNYTDGRIGNVIGNLQKCTKATGKGYAYGFYAATLILWDLFEENDKRRDLSIAPYWYDVNDNKKTWTNKQIVQRSCGKFRREWETSSMKEKSYTPENYPILRYGDVLLMLAEAENEAHQGPTDLAYKCINEIRQRAGISKLKGLSYTDFQQAVRDERARELCFESLRKYDLVRWGIYVEAVHDKLGAATQDKRWATGNQFIGARDYAARTQEKHQFLPIPTKELDVNGKLEQNKYWQ